jgi:hypothetical protein
MRVVKVERFRKLKGWKVYPEGERAKGVLQGWKVERFANRAARTAGRPANFSTPQPFNFPTL